MRRPGTLRRLYAGTGVLVALAAAFGNSAPAVAAQPLVIDNCRAVVEGTPGQAITLNPTAIAGTVVTVVKTLPLVGQTLAEQVGQAIGGMAPIPLGTVPVGGGYISGETIAAAATAALHTLPVLGPVLDTVLPSARSALSAGCGITVQVANAATAPVLGGGGAPGDGRPQPTGAPEPTPTTPPSAKPGNSGNTALPEQGQPATTGLSATSAVGGLAAGDVGAYQGSTGMWDFGRVPPDDYSWVPFATPGVFVPSPDLRNGDQTPGTAAQTGAHPNGTGAGAGNAQRDTFQARVTTAARVVATPVLLAVLVLAAVTAALVRFWAVRRSTSGSGRHRATA